jgi:excisionase family DNA binding protein
MMPLRDMTDNFDPTQWITTGEAAELTGYSASNFRKAIGKRLLRAQKHGRDWFLDRGEVLQYAETMRQLGPNKHNPWDSKERGRKRSATG